MHRENPRFADRAALRRVAHGFVEFRVDRCDRLVEQHGFPPPTWRWPVRAASMSCVVPADQLADRDAGRRADPRERIRIERLAGRALDRFRRRRFRARRLLFDFAVRFARSNSAATASTAAEACAPTPSNSTVAPSPAPRPSKPTTLSIGALRPSKRTSTFASKPRAASRARAAGRACRPPAWASVTLRRASSVTLASLRAASAFAPSLRAQHQQSALRPLSACRARHARRPRTHRYWQSRSPRRDSAHSARRNR